MCFSKSQSFLKYCLIVSITLINYASYNRCMGVIGMEEME